MLSSGIFKHNQDHLGGGGFDGRGGIGAELGASGRTTAGGTGEEDTHVTPAEYPDEDPAEKHGANDKDPASAHRKNREGEP